MIDKIDKDIDHLHYSLAPLCRTFLQNCSVQGIRAIISETFREPAREDDLHARGITKVTSKTCKHCFMIDGKPASKAFDFLILDAAGKVIDDGADPLYARAGMIGKNLGMIWGGNFKNPDYDHFEIA